METGEDSEKQGGPNSWSYHAGEYINSSITTASSLEAWYGTAGVSGAYIVASKGLAQRYNDDELIHSLLLKGKANRCTPGPYKDYNRPPYSGKVQTWIDCGVNDVTSYTVAAAPEGRECVVVLDALLVSEADRKAIEHLIDTFEVDCGRVTSETLSSPSATASPEATTSVSASPESSAEAQRVACDQIQDRLNTGDDSLTSAELLACGLSPEAINPCEGNPGPSCGANLPEGAYPPINGPDGVGIYNACSGLPKGSPEAIACYEDLIGTASPSASP